MSHESTPSLIIRSPEEIGAVVRARRETLRLGLRQAAPAAGVGPRFLSEFERGKPSVELGKVIATLHALGLQLSVAPDTPEETPPEGGYAAYLGMEFPYDWANQRMESRVFLRKVLKAGRFADILAAVGHFGLEPVSHALAELVEPEEVDRAAGILSRIYRGMLLAQAARPAPSGAET